MSEIDAATEKLNTALAHLEGVLDGVFARAGDPAASQREIEALSADRARMAEELDASLAREKELQALADEASNALGSAIAEVRSALDRDGEDNGES